MPLGERHEGGGANEKIRATRERERERERLKRRMGRIYIFVKFLIIPQVTGAIARAEMSHVIATRGTYSGNNNEVLSFHGLRLLSF